jgi:streptomycin 6-kinase
VKPRLIDRWRLPSFAQTWVVAAVRAVFRTPSSDSMKSTRTGSRRRALRMYLAGQAASVAGAAAMSWMHSYVPMALAGSAALMLTVPLVRDIVAKRRVRN